MEISTPILFVSIQRILGHYVALRGTQMRLKFNNVRDSAPGPRWVVQNAPPDPPVHQTRAYGLQPPALDHSAYGALKWIIITENNRSCLNYRNKIISMGI